MVKEELRIDHLALKKQRKRGKQGGVLHFSFSVSHAPQGLYAYV